MSGPASPDKKREWQERIQLQSESGQSVSHWCREHQINYDAMLYWRKQLRQTPPQPIDRSSFKELSPETRGITLEYRSLKIHLGKDFDPTVLTQCLRVLKEAVC